LTTRYHGYNIVDKSDEGRDASLRVEMRNSKLVLNQSTGDNISVIHMIISKVDYV